MKTYAISCFSNIFVFGLCFLVTFYYIFFMLPKVWQVKICNIFARFIKETKWVCSKHSSYALITSSARKWNIKRNAGRSKTAKKLKVIFPPLVLSNTIPTCKTSPKSRRVSPLPARPNKKIGFCSCVSCGFVVNITSWKLRLLVCYQP